MRLIRFGSVVLPTYNRVADDSTMPSLTAYTATLDDEYDELGSDQAPDDGRDIEMEALIYGGAATYIAGTSAATLKQVEWDALRAMRGKRAVLYGNDDSGNILWAYARLLEVTAERRKNLAGIVVRARFHLASGGFNGDRHSAGWNFNDVPPVELNSGHMINENANVVFTLDAAAKTCAVTNGGNRAVKDATLTIALPAAGTAITNVIVAITGVSYVQWLGTLSPGHSLAFNCGTLAVTLDGSDAYAGLDDLGPNHKVIPWFILEPGANNVIITTVGGLGANPATATFAFVDKRE